jgi:tetratricopeptide (TPR) repeat protein
MDGRRAVGAVLTVVALGLFAAPISSQSSGQGSPQPSPSTPPPPPRLRIDLLSQWLEASDRHVPGRVDDSLRRVTGWTNRELLYVTEHVQSVIKLIREPSVRIFFRPIPGSTTRSRQVVYSADELRQLETLAERHAFADESGPCPVDARSLGPPFNGASNLLKRLAVLELDAAIAVRGRAPTRAAGRGQSRAVTFDDGRTTSDGAGVAHLEVARTLLESVTRPCDQNPAPRADDWVRRWYAASLASQVASLSFDVAHLRRALEIFRDDAEMAYFGGAVHESLSSPEIQEGLARANALREELLVGSASAELGQAEDLYRRALARGHAGDARLRLGHVLTRQGKHRDAARELAAAIRDAGEDRRWAYYARIVHGRALEATGDINGARSAYQQAARLYPRAQAPSMALARLLATVDPPGASRELQLVLGRTDAGDPEDDPWWLYYTDAGRSQERRLRDVWATMPRARPQ